MLKNYFKDWSNYLSFAIALVPTILLYIYPSGTKVPFFVFVVLLFCFVLSLWLNVKFFLDSRDEYRPAIELVCIPSSRQLKKYKIFVLPGWISGNIFMPPIVAFHEIPLVLRLQVLSVAGRLYSNLYIL